MSRPGWPGYLLAAVMIVTAGYCVTRLAAARLRRRPTVPDVDISHVVTGVAMAGMLVPRLRVLPDGAWEAVFAVALGWFGWHFIRAYRGPVHGDGARAADARPAGATAAGARAADARAAGAPAAHQAPHLLASGAMLYIFIAVSPAPAGATVAGTVMGGQSAGTIRFPVLALALALALFGYVVWVTDRVSSLAPVSALRLVAAGSAARPGTDSAPSGSGQAWPSLGAPLSPRLAACCEIVMSITMGCMLIVTL